MVNNIADLKYKIKKIEPISHSINIPENFVYSKDVYKMSGICTSEVEIDSTKNSLSCHINFQLMCSRIDGSIDKSELFALKSVTVFTVENIPDYVCIDENGTKELEDDFIRFFFTISLSHARGMQSVYINNTPISKFRIPEPDSDHKFDQDLT
jgi:hypothetical protein